MKDKIEQAFAPARESIDWAKDALSEFKATLTDYFRPANVGVVDEVDPETGENVRKLKQLTPIPKLARRKATDSLLNSRHSFDQAVFAARNLIAGQSKKSIYYPWSQSPTDLNALLVRRGYDERLWDTFAAHHPYPEGSDYSGGDDEIRALARLANDKHTVGLAVSGHIASSRFSGISFTGSPGASGPQPFTMFKPVWDPVKNEAELFRWKGDFRSGPTYEFGFLVLFKDTGLTKPVSALDALEKFASKAASVVDSLQRRCEEILS